MRFRSGCSNGWPAFPEVVAPRNPQLKECFRPVLTNCRAELRPAHLTPPDAQSTMIRAAGELS